MLPARRRFPARLLAAAVAAVMAVSSPAGATTYYVDVAAGVDDTARDGQSTATAWKTLTFAMAHVGATGPHEIVIAPGEYSQATGESFPLTLRPDVSLTGAGPELTIFHDQDVSGVGTLQWTVRTGTVPAAAPTFKNFAIVRDPFATQPVGAGFGLRADNVSAAPLLTNVVLRGAARGLDLYAEADTAAATLAPVIDTCFFLENAIGVLSTAYTATGQAAKSDPRFTNCVSKDNAADGMVFETGASWDIATGQRANSTSTPVITHCTMSDNLGSAVLLDNSNGFVSYRAGRIAPLVTNCVLSGNGDYSLNEYTSTTDPSAFDRNLIGGNLVALYRDEGTTDIQTLGAMPMGTGNLDAVAKFVRSLRNDWHLRGDSPGIDTIATGFPALDADGEARPRDGDGNGSSSADMGADEAWPCAVNAVIDPAAPADRCGLEAPLVFTASASAMAPTFTCTAPLEYVWYADGVEVGTGPDLSTVPPLTTTYTVVVTCPDLPLCRDAATATVVVHSLPAVDAEVGVSGTPTGDYEACIAWDAADVTVSLQGSATATESTATVTTTEWVAAEGILLGGALLNPLLTISNTGVNQDIAVSLTATDTHDCSATSFTRVHVWRGPKPLPGGPYDACQDVGASQTYVQLAGDADIPAGSAPATWLWHADLGQFEDSGSADSTLQNPRLRLTNFGFNRTVGLTLTVTDDKGCTNSASTTLTLYWTPNASANGPYQEPEAAVSPTSIPLTGTYTGPPGCTLSWTTDIGSFQSSGTQAATGADQVLDVPNTGTDQLGQVCVTATPASGLCPNTECTEVSVRVSPPQPPNDIGGTLHVDKAGGVARLSWANPPIDATHDRAERFDAWESAAAAAGAWTPRASLQDVPRAAGGVSVDDAGLLDLAGPDLLFLKIVSENGGGLSCTDPATQLPDCPSIEDCGNGIDDDGDRRIDCADAGCAGIPPC